MEYSDFEDKYVYVRFTSSISGAFIEVYGYFLSAGDSRIYLSINSLGCISSSDQETQERIRKYVFQDGMTMGVDKSLIEEIRLHTEITPSEIYGAFIGEV